MSAIARRTAFAARSRAAFRPTSFATRRTFADKAEDSDFAGDSKTEKKILLAIMTGAFTLAGWHFSRNPTSSSSENRVAQAPDSEPWKTGSDAKYQYHPHGDANRGRKDAPSALNEVIIPNVNLPKSLHEKYNKWGKEGY
ncbi:hypothetical protein D0865_09084 [Hortaea werneckii]|uniref:Uncharacterized protein n=1 Tax=Hortaea werneckii TaxID=91943 RepID=A0A3M7C3T2_HORWE|nr:hypothetical protein D0865_09084 [Hortaea werneckii]